LNSGNISKGIKNLNYFESKLDEVNKKYLRTKNIIHGGSFSYYDKTNNVNVVSISHIFLDETIMDL
jgi:hypothetical protein